jgi:hypothetical protein
MHGLPLPSDPNSLIAAFYYHYQTACGTQPLRHLSTLKKELIEMQFIRDRLLHLQPEHPVLVNMQIAIDSIQQQQSFSKRKSIRQLRGLIKITIPDELRNAVKQLDEMCDEGVAIKSKRFQRWVGYIRDEFLRANYFVLEYQRCFNPSASCNNRWWQECFDYISKVYKIFGQDTIILDELHNAFEYLSYVERVWPANFIRDFEGWTRSLGEHDFHSPQVAEGGKERFLPLSVGLIANFYVDYEGVLFNPSLNLERMERNYVELQRLRSNHLALAGMQAAMNFIQRQVLPQSISGVTRNLQPPSFISHKGQIGRFCFTSHRSKSIHDLLELIKFTIPVELEDSVKKLDHIRVHGAPIDPTHFEGWIGYIAEEILHVGEGVAQYQIRFGKRYGYTDACRCFWAECLDLVNNTHEIFAQATITHEMLVNGFDDLSRAALLWSEYFIYEFEDWIDASRLLIGDTLHLCKEAVIIENLVFTYDEDEEALRNAHKSNMEEIFSLMMKNAMYAEKLFYSFVKNKNHVALALRDTMWQNRRTTGETQTIDANNLSGRTLITSSSGAIARSLIGIRPDQITSTDGIQRSLGWHKTGQINWNRETVSRGHFTRPRAGRMPIYINYQFKPVPGQLGNHFINGVGTYSAILELLNRVTSRESAKERQLARQMLAYKYGDGSALSVEALTAKGFILPSTSSERKKIIEQLNRAAYLICFSEVSRRKQQGYYQSGHRLVKVPELPFGIAVACALKLISDGYLRMKDVFSQDALYGVFTGESVMKDNFLNTIKKFNALFCYFTKKYACKIYPIYEYVGSFTSFDPNRKIRAVFTPEYFHHVLLTADGGGNDSDGEEYQEIFSEKEVDDLSGYISRVDLTDCDLDFQ